MRMHPGSACLQVRCWQDTGNVAGSSGPRLECGGKSSRIVRVAATVDVPHRRSHVRVPQVALNVPVTPAGVTHSAAR
jgi:hypothetical protein